jgi:hypothetical protein
VELEMELALALQQELAAQHAESLIEAELAKDIQ